ASMVAMAKPMPSLAPPTTATLSVRPRSISVLPRIAATEDAQRIVAEDVVENIRLVAEIAPVADQTLIGQERIVRAEHNLLAQPARNLALETVGEVFGRPAVELAGHVRLVQQDGDHFLLPGPGRTPRDDVEVRVSRRHGVDVARMTKIELQAIAAALAGAGPGITDENENRPLRRGADLVERLVDGIARRKAHAGRRDRGADEAGAGRDAALELLGALLAETRINLDPVSEDHVAVRALRFDRIVVVAAQLRERR